MERGDEFTLLACWYAYGWQPVDVCLLACSYPGFEHGHQEAGANNSARSLGLLAFPRTRECTSTMVHVYIRT